jgi:hypothetical protein
MRSALQRLSKADELLARCTWRELFEQLLARSTFTQQCAP